MTPLLAGVRVLDLGHFVAGPLASVVLADLGADVVKVEPITGDPMRAGRTTFVTASNRGKRSIAIDLKSAAGREVFERACAWADVVTHNFRPRSAVRLGVDAASLRERWPDLIVLETSAYGARGPKADLPGYDTIGQAVGGHFVHSSGAGREPLGNRLFHVDQCTGMLGAIGVMAALVRRGRTGAGASVSTSLYDASVFMLSELVRTPEGGFRGQRLLDERELGRGPWESIYQTRDGWVAVVSPDEATAEAALSALGIAPGDEVPALAGAIGELLTAEATERLMRLGVWVEPCDPGARERLAKDDRLRRAGSMIVTTHEHEGERIDTGFGVRVGVDVDPLGRGSVPDAGEHTDQFLRELGYDEPSVRALVDAGAAVLAPDRSVQR